MKHRVLTVLSLSLASSLLFSVIVLNAQQQPNISATYGDASYNIVLTSDAEVTSGKTTASGAKIDFVSSSLSSSSGVGKLDPGGFIYNDTRISGIKNISVALSSGDISIYYGKTSNQNWDGFKHGTSYDLSTILPNYFKIVANQTSVIDSITVQYDCVNYQEEAESTGFKVYVNGLPAEGILTSYPDPGYDAQYKVTMDVYAGDVITFERNGSAIYPTASGNGNNARKENGRNRLIVNTTSLNADLYLKVSGGGSPSYDVWLGGYGDTSFHESSMQDGTILQAWNWSISNISSQLDAIADAGYRAIQISPLQIRKEVYTNYDWRDQWWKLYQPYAYSIAEYDDQGALGTRSDLISLCSAAKAKGIDIIVDVVLNHLSGGDGTTFHDEVQYVEGEIYDNGNKTYIHEYGAANDTHEGIVRGYIGDYPDVTTEKPLIMQRSLALLKDYMDCGVTGFRFDAAKHIETPEDGEYASSFWPYVVNGVKRYAASKGYDVPYCYGEILGAGTDRSLDWYTPYMSFTESSNAYDLREGVIDKNIAKITGNYYAGGGNPSKYVLWAESHDTYKSGATKSMTAEQVDKVYAIQASRKDATALYVARPANDSTLMGAIGSIDFKNDVVSACNLFHSQFAGENEYIEVNNGYNGCFVNVRGSGAMIVNISNDNSSFAVHLPGLADGTYSDLVTGKNYTVSSGYATVSFTDGVCVLVPESLDTYYLIGNSVFTGKSESWTAASGKMMHKGSGSVDAYIYDVEIESGAEVKIIRVKADRTFWKNVVLDQAYDYCSIVDGNLAFTTAGHYNISLSTSGVYSVEKITTRTITIDVTAIDWWDASDALTCVHYWGGTSGSTWPGDIASGSYPIYTVDVPLDATTIVICRVDPENVSDSGVWNKTVDIAFGSYTTFTIQSDAKDGEGKLNDIVRS